MGALSLYLTGGKSVAGTVACWLAVFAVTLRVTGQLDTSVVIAAAAALLEAAPTRDWDNLLLPAGTGLVAVALL